MSTMLSPIYGHLSPFIVMYHPLSWLMIITLFIIDPVFLRILFSPNYYQVTFTTLISPVSLLICSYHYTFFVRVPFLWNPKVTTTSSKGLFKKPLIYALSVSSSLYRFIFVLSSCVL